MTGLEENIDAHQHFWSLDRGDYHWLTLDMALLYRDFGPAELAPFLQRHGIGGTVLVQAAATVAETEYMLAIAAEDGFRQGRRRLDRFRIDHRPGRDRPAGRASEAQGLPADDPGHPGSRMDAARRGRAGDRPSAASGPQLRCSGEAPPSGASAALPAALSRTRASSSTMAPSPISPAASSRIGPARCARSRATTMSIARSRAWSPRRRPIGSRATCTRYLDLLLEAFGPDPADVGQRLAGGGSGRRL